MRQIGTRAVLRRVRHLLPQQVPVVCCAWVCGLAHIDSKLPTREVGRLRSGGRFYWVKLGTRFLIPVDQFFSSGWTKSGLYHEVLRRHI